MAKREHEERRLVRAIAVAGVTVNVYSEAAVEQLGRDHAQALLEQVPKVGGSRGKPLRHRGARGRRYSLPP
jgi:hypothetical protein